MVPFRLPRPEVNDPDSIPPAIKAAFSFPMLQPQFKTRAKRPIFTGENEEGPPAKRGNATWNIYLYSFGVFGLCGLGPAILECIK